MSFHYLPGLSDPEDCHQYRNVLDEWSTGTPSTVKLDSKQYGKISKAILDSMEIVDRNIHYGPLLRQRLAAWAGFGEYVYPYLTCQEGYSCYM